MARVLFSGFSGISWIGGSTGSPRAVSGWIGCHCAGRFRVVGAGFKPAPTPTKRHGLPEIVRAFKTFSARRINESRRTPGESVWQRNYYDRIIRDEDELNRIREYIIDNPLKWDLDNDNPQNWNSHTKNNLGD